MVLRLVSLMLMVSLSGCFIAPGMKMRYMPAGDGGLHQIKPTFIPIDVNLVRQLNANARCNQDDAYYYHVGPHDVLNIHVWGHPEFVEQTGQPPSEIGMNIHTSMIPSGYLVNPDGNIYFPLVKTVYVAGKTVEQIRVKLTALLRKYIRNPQLDVRITGFRSKKIYVMGEVKRPGLLPITDSPMSLTDAINLADGFDPKTADPGHIFVIRGDYACPLIYWLNASSPEALLLGENFRLRSQDIVFISSAPVAQWNRAIEQILPTIQTIWFTSSIINQGYK